MNLRESIPKTPARQAVLFLGGLFCWSCIGLLSEGIGHLRIFLPLAAVNLLAGVLASERVARVFLILELCLIFASLGYQFLRLHGRHLQ